MDNRFNIKDILFVLLILMMAGLVGMQMWQQDRQWDVMQEILTELKENGGPSVASQRPTDPADVQADTTFERVADLRDKEDFAEGDYFIDSFSTTVKNLTPYVAGDIYASRIGAHVMETLVTVDLNTLEHKPWIAKSWDISDDGLIYTFYLRDDVVFSDGEKLDANDVVFTYNWVMNPQVAAPRMRSQLEKMESVEALDDLTVRFTFREPYFMSLTVAGLYLEILPEHWVSQFTEDEYNEMPGLMMGSGPYMLDVDPKEWEPATQKITLVRNDNYWGPRPPLDRIIWREILEPTAQLTGFRNREIDRFSVRPSMYRELSTDEQLRNQANLLEYAYVSSGYIYVGWNQKKNGQPTAFANKLVRQAMTHLIDRDTICGQVYENLARTTSGPFHPLGWQGDPSIKPWPYDPERAKALLDEAGYMDRDNNGVRESPQGEPLSFEFIYSTGGTESKDIASRIKASMAQAGVECRPVAMDWPVMQQKLDDRSFDSIMLGWGGAHESDLYQMFHSDQTQDGGDNYVSYTNPELDELIDAARTSSDRATTQKLWWKVHQKLHEDQPYTFMFNRKSVVLMDKRIKNVEITKLGLNYAWEYFVPKPMQLHTGD
jgi:peptide/nickel transport system substrate-binding protein